MPDPKLKAAMEEIKPILAKYDCAAIVLLSSPDSIEYLRRFQTAWNCIREVPPDAIRIRCKLADFNGDKAAQKRAAELTAGTFLGFRDTLMEEIEIVDYLARTLGKHWLIEHRTMEEPPAP